MKALGKRSSSPPRNYRKRQIDFEIIGQWVEPKSRVLDLGCGRGVLLEVLRQSKEIYPLGVDISIEKISSCLKRGINAFQSDVDSALAAFEDDSFDTVVISRTLEMLLHPEETLGNALRVGQRVAVGFVNHGFWKNRLSFLFRGQRLRNAVYPLGWHESEPHNPVSIGEFEAFCRSRGIRIRNRAVLSGDWKTPCRLLPTLFGGYAIYELEVAAPPATPN